MKLTQTKFFIYLSVFSRIFVGIVFIFSGFVKAVDPLGSEYKFVDYFEAFGTPWMEPFALFLAFLLSGLEFLVGLCLLFSVRSNLAHWGALLFMVVFTPLTLWLALTNPVHDCGCFGDALILTNWQTFYKNIIILFFLLISFSRRNKFKPWLSIKAEWIFTGVMALLITFFMYYNVEHLPIIDFRPYKVGTYIPEKMVIPEGAPRDVYEQYFILKDTTTGKEIKVEMKEYTKDSTYWGTTSKYKFVSSTEPVLVKKGYEPPIHDFNIVTLEGDDITQDVLNDSCYYFLLIAYDLNKTRTKRLQDINKFYEDVIKDNNKFICLTAVSEEVINAFKKEHNIKYEFCITDPITLKTMIRANPGLMMLKKGTVMAMWHSNDIPEYQKVKEKYMK